MTAIPEPTINIKNLIYQMREAKQEKPRPHMGCSMLGHPCDRFLWLSFRWMVIPHFSGRVLGLFERGKREEEIVIRELRAIGVDVQNVKNQFHVDFGCHVSGSLDGIIHSGVPAAPKKKHILEIKTHKDTMFKALEKDGVEKSHPSHVVQMHCYMLGSNIDRALYYGVGKNDDDLHIERIKLDEEVAKKAIARGHRVVKETHAPPRISENSTWYQCKMCDCWEFCHVTKKTKEANCRTCAHSTPLENSTWRCERHGADGIPVEFQRVGCESHVIHPDSVPWTREASQNPHVAVYLIDGKRIQNGEPDAHTFGSKELLSENISEIEEANYHRMNTFGSKELLGNTEACVKQEPIVMEIRKELGARIEASEEIPF